MDYSGEMEISVVGRHPDRRGLVVFEIAGPVSGQIALPEDVLLEGLETDSGNRYYIQIDDALENMSE